MTLEEIRAVKHKAEKEIHAILATLADDTGLCPIGVEVETLGGMHIYGTTDMRLCGLSIKLQEV